MAGTEINIKTKDQKNKSDKSIEQLKIENALQVQSQQVYEQKQKELRNKLQKKLSKLSYEDLIENAVAEQEGVARASRTTGSMALITNNKIGWIEPITVLDDHKLIANVNGPKELAIFEEPITVYMNMRNHWGIYGIVSKIKLKIACFFLWLLGMNHYGLLKFNLYGLKSDGEYTIPIMEDRTPLESQRKVEEYLKIANPADQGKALANMMKGLGESDPWWKTGQWLITILLIIFMFLYVMNGGKV